MCVGGGGGDSSSSCSSSDVFQDSSVICMSVALQKVVHNQSHISPIAEELSQRFIVDGYEIKDKVDVVFLSRIIEGFSRNIASNDKVEVAAVHFHILCLLNFLLTILVLHLVFNVILLTVTYKSNLQCE